MKSSNEKRVLIIQSVIPHYRVSVFNELSKHVDLTLMYDSGSVPENVNFSTKKVEIKKSRLKIHKINILKYVKQFDVVIMTMNYSFLTTWLLSFLPIKTRVILWGIGVSADYKTRYDEKQKVAMRLLHFIKHTDATIFYAEYPVEKYAKLGIPKEKMFVANNTVEVLDIDEEERNSLVFVGTLYKQKKIFELLNSYYNAYLKNPSIPELVIVGDGAEFQAIKSWILEKELEEKITMTGAIFDEEKLSKYFAKALMCISPDQAGLSVLKSFGYGVPFITHKDAITGGERLNIINGENGVLFESFSEIETLILDYADDKKKYIDMGANAKRHYKEKRTIADMAKGFIDAIEYVAR